MDTENAAAGGELEAAPVVSAPNLEGDSLSVDQAFEAYQKRINPTAESADTATAETQSADEADAAPLDEAHGEDEEIDPVEEPSIDRPKSWTESEDAEWRATPRALQQKIVARELERDTALRRTQNEAADSKKALEAELEQTKQAKTQYEAKLTSVVKTMEDALQADFGDIQSLSDVRKLQAEDPFRFQAWQVRQMELAAAQGEKRDADQRNAQEKQGKRATYEAEQNKILADMVPEMADPKKSVEMRERAVAMLTSDLGLTMNQLQRWMADDTGHEILSNAGIQKLIADRLTLQEIKAAPPKAIPKPVPAVQKPGVAPAKGSNANDVQALRNKLSGSGSVEDAFALYQAKQKRRA